MSSILNIAYNPEDHIHLVFSHSLIFPNKIFSFSEISYTNYFGQVFRPSLPQELTAFSAKNFVYLSTNPNFCVLDRGEFILTYTFLKNYLSSIGYLPISILDLFHRKIQEIIINLRANDSKTAQSSLLPLLHILENILTIYPIISYDSMDALIIDLDIIRRWPVPYGLLAHKLLELVIKELKSPGSAMRYKFRDEFPMIDLCVPIFEQNSHVSSSLYRKPTAFVILDSFESLENSYFFRISNCNKKLNKEKLALMVEKIYSDLPVNTSAVYAHVNRCLSLLFVLSLYTELTTADLSHIAGLSVESIFGLYRRIIQMVDKIANEEMDRARTLQEWFVLELYEELKNLKSDRANPLTEPLFIFLSEFDIYFPQIPVHNVCVIDLSNVTQRVETADDTSFLINESLASTPDEPIINILKQSINSQYSDRSLPIKIVLTGSDCITHKFLRTYIKALSSSKNPSDYDIRCYSIPTYNIQNTLSMYLASIDPWYTRHVYLPFYYRPWLPRLDTKIDVKNLQKKGSDITETILKTAALDPAEIGGLNEKSLPISISEILLQDYLTEARHIININVYKIKCFKDDLSKPEEIIPMCLFLEIGAPAVVKRLQELNLSFKDKTFAEVVENKAFRFRSLSLQMQMSQMDLMGNLCGLDEIVVKNVYSLAVSNVPRESDKCMQPIPNAEWVELSFIEREAAEQENLLIKKIKNKKIKDPQSQVNIAISSLYSNLHVASGKISLADAGEMDVVVDGVLYGPFKLITFEPWIGENSLQVTMPLYTFLDFC